MPLKNLPANQTENNDSKNQTCPYLGLEKDPTTWLSYANSDNFCHKTKPPRPVDPQHQLQFCLTPAYRVCKIYAQNTPTPLPSVAPVETRQDNQNLRNFRISLGILSALTVIMLAVFWLRFNWVDISSPFYSAAANTPSATISAPTHSPSASATMALLPILPLPTESPTPLPTHTASASLTPTHTSTPTASVTTQPTSTFTITPTSSTPGPALNTPFGPTENILLHRVATGESLGNLAAAYRTSVDAIRAANVLIEGASVWPDTVLVIYPDTKDLSLVTRFQVIQLKKPAYPEELAETHQVPLADLLKYNQLDARVLIPAGRWLVLPVSQP